GGLEIGVADAVDEQRGGPVLHPSRAEGGKLEDVLLGFHADLLKEAGDRLGRLAVVGNAAGEAVELGLEAVREAGLGKQRLRLARIERVGLNARVVSQRSLV